jgi:hypothetical protein
MAQFADRVKKLEGQWIVTVDDSPFNRDMFKGYDFHAVKTRNGVKNQRLRPLETFGELIIRSPKVRAAQVASLRKAA